MKIITEKSTSPKPPIKVFLVHFGIYQAVATGWA